MLEMQLNNLTSASRINSLAQKLSSAFFDDLPFSLKCLTQNISKMSHSTKCLTQNIPKNVSIKISQKMSHSTKCLTQNIPKMSHSTECLIQQNVSLKTFKNVSMGSHFARTAIFSGHPKGIILYYLLSGQIVQQNTSNAS